MDVNWIVIKMKSKKLFFYYMIILLAAFIVPAAANEQSMDMGNMDMSNTPPPDHAAGTGSTGHASGGVINWVVIAIFLLAIAAIGFVGFNTEKLSKINFLDNPQLKALLKSKWYPLIFVLPTMIIFGILVIQLFYGSEETSLNFGSVMVWILLWPILPVLFLILGRAWCSVCPLSRVSDEVQKNVGMHKKVPKFLQTYGVWIIIIAFLIITWADTVLGLVESPRNTGYLLLFIFTGVVLIGAVYERRAWCRYLCFLGGLSSNYSMSSALELRADANKCKTCKTPTCFKGDGKVDGCSMFEYPRTMDSNRFCNFCSNCIKTCQLDAIRITPRIPTSELWFIKKPRFEESFLATALIGIVIVQTLVMLEVWEPFMNWFENTTDITDFTLAWTIIFGVAMLIPVFVMLGASFISTQITKEKSNVNLISDPSAQLSLQYPAETSLSSFIRYGYALIPLGLGIHLAHNAKHFLGEGLAVVYTSASLVGLNLSGDPSILNMPTIRIIQYILSVLGVLGAVYTAHKISQNNPDSKVSVWPYIVLMLMFGLIALWMYSVPMAARGH